MSVLEAIAAAVSAPGPSMLTARWAALVAVSVIGGLVIFFAVALPLHYFYYVKRRDRAPEWKIRKDRFLPDRLNRQALRLTVLNLTVGGALSGSFIEYVMRGGYTTLYFEISDYGIPYLLLSTVILFFWAEAAAYYVHRLIHVKWIYRRIHKYHHRYVATTPFVTIAMHPLELISLQTPLFLILFVVPMYAPLFALHLIYALAYNIIGHSGIEWHSKIPWQASSKFHDDHHRYFHCNFGQHMTMWDRMHGTLRRDDRAYSEEIFGGRGTSGRSDDDGDPVTY